MSTVVGVTQRLDQDALVRMYSLDLSVFGGPVLRFTDAQNGEIFFGGNLFSPTDIELSGIEVNTADSTQYPSVKLGHLNTPAVGYLDDFDDLIGAKFYRYRTYARFLDDGTEPDPTQMFPPDKFYVERLVHLDSATLEFELRPVMNIGNRFLPKRMVLSTYCDFIYRRWDTTTSAFVNGSCPWAEATYYDEKGDVTVDPTLDKCSKTLDLGCKKRFGENAVLPYRGFPGIRRVR